LENSRGKAVNEDKRVGEGLICFLNFENTATRSVSRLLIVSRIWKIAFDVPNKPEDFKKLVEKMCGFVPTIEKDIAVASERLYREIHDLVIEKLTGIERDDLCV